MTVYPAIRVIEPAITFVWPQETYRTSKFKSKEVLFQAHKKGRLIYSGDLA